MPSSAPVPEARAWQRMLSGRRLDLLNPSPLDIEIEDIAHGLARVARWNGQTTGDHAFSVAEHCLARRDHCGGASPGLDRRYRLAALIHDAPEYVIGDLISPFKAALSLDYKAFEKKLLAAIHIRFGLPPELPADITKLIKRADKIAAYYEVDRARRILDRGGAPLFRAAAWAETGPGGQTVAVNAGGYLRQRGEVSQAFQRACSMTMIDQALAESDRPPRFRQEGA